MNGETPGVASATTNLIERLKTLEARIYAADGHEAGRHMRNFLDALSDAWPELWATIDRLERENATYQGVTKALHEEREKNRKLLAVVEAAKREMRDNQEELFHALAALEEKE